MRLVLMLIVVGLIACDSPTEPTGYRATQNALGESSTSVIFGNENVVSPNYDERVVHTLSNRVRVNSDNFGITDMDGNIIPPNPPMTYQIGMAEAGKWQGRHALNYSCFCPQDPMAEPAAWNSCCQVGFVNGTAQCVGPITSCDGEDAMEQEDRWNVLNRGPGQIGSEIYLTSADPAAGTFGAAVDFLFGGALGFLLQPSSNAFSPALSSVPLPPDNCVDPEDSCGEGTCVNSETGEEGCVEGEDPNNPDCIGSCSGGPRNGQACNIPEPLPEECEPENFPLGYYWSFGFGQTTEPIPPIADGIHVSLAGANMGDPATLAILSHYYDGVGDPRSFQVVFDGQCIDMALEFDRPVDPGGDAGAVDMGPTDFPLHGDTWIASWTQGDLNPGCYRYILAATDAEGFVHTYPSLGSLGAVVTQDGLIGGGDDTCPVWDPTRPATTCLSAANECNDGDTRLCYTGREGTQGKGLCTSGTETCERGRWNGVCAGEVLPEIGEVCGDQTDNNCNGFADEGCPILAMPVDMGGNNTPDLGGGEDVGSTEDTGGNDVGTKKTEEGGCCATASDKPTQHWMLLIVLGLVGLIRRRR